MGNKNRAYEKKPRKRGKESTYSRKNHIGYVSGGWR
jgi:hypothetical protein